MTISLSQLFLQFISNKYLLIVTTILATPISFVAVAVATDGRSTLFYSTDGLGYSNVFSYIVSGTMVGGMQFVIYGLVKA